MSQNRDTHTASDKEKMLARLVASIIVTLFRLLESILRLVFQILSSLVRARLGWYTHIVKHLKIKELIRGTTQK